MSYATRGELTDETCDLCGRRIYVTRWTTERKCSGCGEDPKMCMCPDTREYA